MIKLRPYQQDAENRLIECYKDGAKAALLVLPTGGGKTVVFSDITAKSRLKGNKVLLLVHREELLKQASKSFKNFGIPHGLIAAGYSPAYYEQVQIASVQTLSERLDKYKATCGEPNFIIIDEAHHAVAGSWGKIIAEFPNAKILGVSATPERLDGQGLGLQVGGVFEQIVIGATVTDLIGLGYLAPPIIYAPPAPSDKGAIIGDVVAHYRKLAHNVPTAVFCRTVKHAKEVAEQFKEAGYRAACVDGTLSKEERDQMLAGLGNGSLHVVTSCDIISEGTDIPAIGCAILLRKTASLSLYLQQVGRALRVCEGKEHAIILDHVGNSLVHGLPTDEWEWSLLGEKQRKRKADASIPKVKQCARCYAVYAPTGSGACPQCSFLPKPKGRKIINEAGELVEVSAEEADRKKIERKRNIYDCQTLPELLAFQRANGYKEGWAQAIFVARQRKERNK